MKKLDIKRALSEHNMTQADLYQKIGMSPQAICMIIKNNNPTVAKLMQIAEGIGCDITDLFYPDPSEEAEEREKALENAKNSKMPLELILRDLTRKAYPSITKEEIDEWMEVLEKKKGIQKFDIRPGKLGLLNAMDRLRQFEEARKKHDGETLNAALWGGLPEDVIERDVNFVQQAEENQQQMIQTSTFCPHCGKKVRVGVVLLDS